MSTSTIELHNINDTGKNAIFRVFHATLPLSINIMVYCHARGTTCANSVM